jgi:hypothetical protein
MKRSVDASGGSETAVPPVDHDGIAGESERLA